MCTLYCRIGPCRLSWGRTIFAALGGLAWVGSAAAEPPNENAPVHLKAQVSAPAVRPGKPPADGRVFEPEPTPNQELTAPHGPFEPAHTAWSPTMMHQQETYRGEGYVPGSTAQITQESRRLSLPGINLRVPLN